MLARGVAACLVERLGYLRSGEGSRCWHSSEPIPIRFGCSQTYNKKKAAFLKLNELNHALFKLLNTHHSCFSLFKIKCCFENDLFLDTPSEGCLGSPEGKTRPERLAARPVMLHTFISHLPKTLTF